MHAIGGGRRSVIHDVRVRHEVAYLTVRQFLVRLTGPGVSPPVPYGGVLPSRRRRGAKPTGQCTKADSAAMRSRRDENREETILLAAAAGYRTLLLTFHFALFQNSPAS